MMQEGECEGFGPTHKGCYSSNRFANVPLYWCCATLRNVRCPSPLMRNAQTSEDTSSVGSRFRRDPGLEVVIATRAWVGTGGDAP